MTTINLYQSSQSETEKLKKSSALDAGFIFSIAIFAISLLVYGGAFLYTNFLSKNIANIDTQIASEREKFSGVSVDKPVDFFERINAIEQTQTDLKARKTIDYVAEQVIAGVAMKKFSYVDGKYKITFYTDGLTNVARQLLALKKAKNLSNVSIEGIEKGERIEFTVSMDYIK